ncbi:MAG: SOS response-associated peptidase family protein [Rhodomicrobium sp.]
MSWKLSCTVLRGGVAGNSASLLDRELAVPDQKKPAKMPFYVSRKDGLPFTFAGLWERWGPDNLLTWTILTTDATEALDGIFLSF